MWSSNNWAITQTLAGQHAAGKWSAIQNGVGNLAGVSAPWFTGWVVGLTGHFFIAFLVAALIAIAGAGMFVFGVGPIKPVIFAPRGGERRDRRPLAALGILRLMSATESTMLGLGTSAPAFDLPDTVSGRNIRLDSFAGKKGLLVMFLCPHCPYVKHIHSGLAALAKDYAASDLGMVAISSNDAGQYPDDGPDGLRQMARKLGFQFPFCYDETQETAKAYQAACTPDFFLFDR